MQRDVSVVLRRRLFTAIGAGVLLAGPACGGTASSEGAGVSPAKADTNASGAGSDTSGSGGTSVGGSASSANASSGGTSSGPSNSNGGSSAGGTQSTTSSGGTGSGGTGSGSGGSPTDTTTDSGGTDSGGTSSGSGGSATDGSLQCSGQLAEFCLSVSQMENLARYGAGQVPLDPPRSDEEIADAWDANGCMRHDWVATGCCNPGLKPGEPRDTECCYIACEGSCCGRPLVLAGQAVTAKVVTRTDWCSPKHSPQSSPSDSAALAELWTRDGLAEHASVAVFARFTLELMALGAPADLVFASQRASMDEVSHARLCFSIASRLAGEPIGPGPLPEALAPLHSQLADLVIATIHEGCVGESLAAAVALEQSRVAKDPEVRRALEKIAEDEARHAELAWRFVAWALACGGRQLQQRAREAFETAWSKADRHSESTAEPALAPSDVLHHWGRLTARETSSIERRVIRDALMPAANQLFSSSQPTLEPAQC